MKTKQLFSSFRGAIIIPAHNEENLISNCLNAIAISINQLQNPQEVEVVVVDNNSSDNTSKIAESFNNIIPNLSVIREKEVGIGYARATGIRFALMKSIKDFDTQKQDFWLINTDADGIVPKSWLVDWFNLFSETNSLIFTGSSEFGNSFNMRYPVASKLFNAISKKISHIEQLFGVINMDGFNSAVERNCYNVAGPFQQPKGINNKGQLFNLPGEDWDLSTRARLLGIRPLRSPAAPVVVSSRRFEISPLDFFNGNAYEEPFIKVESFHPAPDIKPKEYIEIYKKATLRSCVHFVEKPILVDNNLLNNSNVYQQVGLNLIKEMQRWIELTPKPDIFYHRDKFILDYLAKFHIEFGYRIRESLFK